MMNRRVQKDDGTIASCQMWIADNYASANPVGMMAEQTGLNRRTFIRRFRAATGYLPLEYVHRLRIEEAKQLTEREAGNLDEVGSMVGYEDPAFFRRLFKRQTGLTPAAYRRSQLKFYEKHHPAWVPWLRAYLKLRGELPDNP
jgi:transcriptional regulator GlxA family with amidase domain